MFLGLSAGSKQTTLSNRLIIDNQSRANAATEITDCLMYGIFDADPANQSLRINANLITSSLVVNDGPVVYTPSSVQSFDAADTITVTHAVMLVKGNGGAVTLTSTPTIAGATVGTRVTIRGTDSTDTLTLQDERILAGTKLRLENGASMTLGKGDEIVIEQSSDDKWYQKSRSDNA